MIGWSPVTHALCPVNVRLIVVTTMLCLRRLAYPIMDVTIHATLPYLEGENCWERTHRILTVVIPFTINSRYVLMVPPSTQAYDEHDIGYGYALYSDIRAGIVHGCSSTALLCCSCLSRNTYALIGGTALFTHIGYGYGVLCTPHPFSKCCFLCDTIVSICGDVCASCRLCSFLTLGTIPVDGCFCVPCHLCSVATGTSSVTFLCRMWAA